MVSSLPRKLSNEREGGKRKVLFAFCTRQQTPLRQEKFSQNQLSRRCLWKQQLVGRYLKKKKKVLRLIFSLCKKAIWICCHLWRAVDFICNYCEWRSLASASQSWKCHRFLTHLSLWIFIALLFDTDGESATRERSLQKRAVRAPVVMVFPKALPWARGGCAGTDVGCAHSVGRASLHRQPPLPWKSTISQNFWSYHTMIWLRKELKDRLFPTTPFQCGYPQHHFSVAVFSVLKKLTAPTAFAWRAEDGDAQQIQVPWHS